MQINEKKSEYKNFIQSENFTIASYSALSLFSVNIRKMNNLVKKEANLASTLYENKDQKVSTDNLNEAGFIQLDILCKIMMMIEGVCALITALNIGIKEVPKSLSFYSSGVVKQLGEKLNSYSVQDKKAFMRRILRLPNLNLLTYLSKKERKFLNEILSETCEINYDRLTRSINFYMNHQIAYNKFKHGLSFLSYMPSFEENSQTAISMALHRGKKPKHEANLLPLKGSFLPEEYTWYNTISFTHASKDALERYLKFSDSIDDFAHYIIQNNLLYSENCGLDYLPLKLLEGNKKCEPWLYVKPSKDRAERVEKVMSIYKKALPHIHISLERIGRFEFHFNKEAFKKLEHCIKHFGIAVAWASNENVGAPSIYHKIEMK